MNLPYVNSFSSQTLASEIYSYGQFEAYYDSEGSKYVRVNYANSGYYDVEDKETSVVTLNFVSYPW